MSGSWLDNTLRVWDVASGKTEWQALRLDAETTVTLDPSGSLLPGEQNAVESSLLYMLERRDGATEVVTVSDFIKRCGSHWLSSVARRFEEVTEAHELIRSEAELALALTVRGDVDVKGRIQNFQIARQLADALYFEREYTRAEQANRIAIDVQQQVVQELPDDRRQKDVLSARWMQLGAILAAAGRNTESLRAITNSIELLQEPMKSGLNQNDRAGTLAVRFYERAQRQPTLDAAMSDLDRVVELYPAFNDAGWSLIYFLDDLVEEPADSVTATVREIPAEQQFEIAKAVYLEAVRRLPKRASPFMFANWLSSAPERFRDPELALQEAQRSLGLIPTDSHCQEHVAWAKYRLGDPQGCLSTLDNATGNKNLSEFIRAMALQKLGNKSEARLAFDRGFETTKVFLQTLYMDRWKGKVLWHPTPGMLRRLQAEAAAMLGVNDGQVQAAAPPLGNGSNP